MSPVAWIDRSEILGSAIPSEDSRISLRSIRATSGARYRTTPEMNPALRRGGLISFFRKQCGSRPT